MRQMRPFFTVIVPTYNQAQYLGAALDSLLAQTFDDWEAVIVDDGSTDDTAAVLARYEGIDRRFRFLRKENGGVATALNRGLELASGDWVCWLSSDDLFSRDKLSIHRHAMTSNPEFLFHFTNSSTLEEGTGIIRDHRYSAGRREHQTLDMLHGNFIAGNSICVRRDAFSQIGGFDERLRYAQDYHMWLRLMARFPALFVESSTSIIRVHPLQGTSRFPEATDYDAATAAIRFLNCQKFQDMLPSLNLDDPDVAVDALIKALSIASNPASLIYALGPHPALVDRIAEWIASAEQAACRDRLRAVAHRWASHAQDIFALPRFARCWQNLAHLTQRKSFTFSYVSVSPEAVADRTYLYLHTIGDAAASSLYRYITQVERRPAPIPPPRAEGPGLRGAGTCPSSAGVSPVCLASALRALRNLRYAPFTSQRPAMELRSQWIPIRALGLSLYAPDLVGRRAWWLFVLRTAIIPRYIYYLLQARIRRGLPNPRRISAVPRAFL